MKLYVCDYGHQLVLADLKRASVPCEHPLRFVTVKDGRKRAVYCDGTATPNTDCVAEVGPTSDGDTRCGRETAFEGSWFCESHRT